MQVWMLTGLIAFNFGCTAQHDDKQAAKDPAAIHDSHDEKTSASNDIHSSHGDSGNHGTMNMNAVTRRVLNVQSEPQEPTAGSPAELTLQIPGDDGKPIRQFDVMHEKLVHLIVVRDGLDEFAHLHPEVDSAGNLTDEYEFPKSGIYRIWGQFQHNGTVFTVPFVLEYMGGNRH